MDSPAPDKQTSEPLKPQPTKVEKKESLTSDSAPSQFLTLNYNIPSGEMGFRPSITLKPDADAPTGASETPIEPTKESPASPAAPLILREVNYNIPSGGLKPGQKPELI
jgi:hypothetical protein